MVGGPAWRSAGFRLGWAARSGQVAAKPRPSRPGDCGRVDTTAGRDPAARPLLVRRAALAGERDVAVLLRDVPVDPGEVADLMRHHRVLVLSDLTLPPTAPPIAVAAFRLHRSAGTAQLIGIGVAGHLRRRGLGHRLLTGALTWLRAEGLKRVQACAVPGGASASLLASAGFTTDHQTARADGRSPFVLLL
jgi:GNAT superfamily N-acetyltransferase